MRKTYDAPPVVVINLSGRDIPEQSRVMFDGWDATTGAKAVRIAADSDQGQAIAPRRIKSERLGIIHLVV